jgi:hypothetical protein
VRTTLPVKTMHVGAVIVPINGAEGKAFIVTGLADVTIPQPSDEAIVLVTV